MTEYIEREAAIMATKNDGLRGWQAIKKLPAADVAPVVYGRWMQTDDGDWECSNCKNAVAICECGKDVTHKKHYCPNCGARMDLPNLDTEGGAT